MDVPDRFHDEFNQKGEKFFQIARILYGHSNREYTQAELAKQVDRSKTRISDHVQEMEESDWVSRKENQTTFSWNHEAHNPASTDGTTAVRLFYEDFLKLLEKHSTTGPGTLAIIGFGMLLTSIVVFAFYIGFTIKGDSAIPPVIYLSTALGALVIGLLMTFVSPLHARLNRFISKFNSD